MFAAIDKSRKRTVIWLLVSLAFALAGLGNGIYKYMQSPAARRMENPVATNRHNCSAGFYPPGSARRREQGQNQVDFIIGRDGIVKDAKVTQSSSFAELDRAAISCVRSWTYRPAMMDGQPVATPWRVGLEWRLE